MVRCFRASSRYVVKQFPSNGFDATSPYWVVLLGCITSRLLDCCAHHPGCLDGVTFLVFRHPRKRGMRCLSGSLYFAIGSADLPRGCSSCRRGVLERDILKRSLVLDFGKGAVTVVLVSSIGDVLKQRKSLVK